MRKNFFVFLAIFFSSGIIIAFLLEGWFLKLYIFSWVALLAGYFIFYRKLFLIFISVFFIILGVLSKLNYQVLPKNHLDNYIYHFYKADNLCLAFGVIQQQIKSFGRKSVYIMEADQIITDSAEFRCCGKLAVIFKDKQKIEMQTLVRVKGKIYPYFKKSKSFYDKYLRSLGVCAFLKSDLPPWQINRNGFNSAKLSHLSRKLKNAAKKSITAYLSPEAAAIFTAMVLGDKSYLSYSTKSLMVESGTFHILVVSGFMVGLVSLFYIFILKLLGFSRKIRAYLIIPFLSFYCFLVGPSASVFRSTIMAGIFYCSYLFKREYQIRNSLALSCLLILLINPAQLFNSAFQLSFASIAGIVYLYPRLKAFLGLNLLNSVFLKGILSSFALSLSVWLATAGLCAYYFRIISFISAFANLLVIPLASLAAISGILMICASFFSYHLAKILGASCELFLSLILRSNFFLIHLPGAHLHLS